jgi:hypothetical protein
VTTPPAEYLQNKTSVMKLVIKSMTNHAIGYQTHNLLVCSAEPQPTAPSCAPFMQQTQMQLTTANYAEYYTDTNGWIQPE